MCHHYDKWLSEILVILLSLPDLVNRFIDMPNKSDSRVPYTRWEAVNEGDEEDDESGGSPIQVWQL